MDDAHPSGLCPVCFWKVRHSPIGKQVIDGALGWYGGTLVFRDSVFQSPEWAVAVDAWLETKSQLGVSYETEKETTKEEVRAKGNRGKFPESI